MYFPMLYNLENKKILIVGGGNIALHKLKILSKFNADITVLSSEIKFDFDKVILKDFEEKDVENYDIVIGATNDESVNAQIYSACKKRKIPVNIVDDKDKSDFIFPAMTVKKNLVVAVSTMGASPTASAKIRDEIEENLPADIEEKIEKLSEYRKELIDKNIPYNERKKLLEKYYDENS